MAKAIPQAETLADLELAARAKAQELDELQRQLDEARAAAMQAFVGQLRKAIAASEFDYDEVTSALMRPQRHRTTAGRRREKKRWHMKSDPSCVYQGQGQLPRCILVRMREEGLDPKSAEDKRQFFDQFMERSKTRGADPATASDDHSCTEGRD